MAGTVSDIDGAPSSMDNNRSSETALHPLSSMAANPDATAVKADASMAVNTAETKGNENDMKLIGKDGEEIPDAKAKAKRLPKASLSKMLSLGTRGELALLALGVFGAVGNGCLQPLVIFMWGDMIDGLAAPATPDPGSGGVPGFGGFTGTTTTIPMAGAMDAMMDTVGGQCRDITILGIFGILFGSLQGFSFKKYSELMQQRMLNEYYDIVLYKDIQWFDFHDPASLPAQMSSDAITFGDAWGDKLGTSFMGLATFLGGYTLAFLRGWPIALIMVGTLPLIAIGAILMGSAMQNVQLETQTWYEKAAVVAEETFYAVRTVVAFGAEPRAIAEYSSAVTKARWGGVRNSVKIGAGMGYTMAIMFLSYGLAFYVGMRFRYDNSENPSTGEPWKPGEILGVFFCVLMGSFMLGTIDPGVKAFEAARTSAARFFEACDAVSVIQCRTADTRKPITSIDTIELKQVHFSYPATPDVKILDGLTLAVKQGEKVAVVGESGSGKSTVMSLMARFYDADVGEVLINGENIKNFSISELRKCIGYVGQEPVLFATSVRENILQGTADPAQMENLGKVMADAQLAFIDDLPDKLETYVGSGGLQMSGGQKQRIAIARALIKSAKVLFFDEATSALDNVSEKMIQETIDKLSTSNSSLTIVTIAHRLSTVRSSDCIYVLSKGTLAESGNHTDLMAKEGLYYALVASQDMAVKNEEGDAPERQISGSNSREHSSGKKQRNTVMMMADESVKERESLNATEEARQKEILKKYKAPMRRLLGFCKAEWPFLLPGVLAALYDGGTQPMVGFLLVSAMYGFQLPAEEMKKELEQVCIWFTLLSVGEFFAATISAGCFGMLGESLTMRMRTALYSKVFEQEIGFHDDPDNSAGSLTAALQIYAFRVQNLCKAIGAKAAAMSALVLGLSIAFIWCWQMAAIMLLSVPITIAANMLQMAVMLGGNSAENEKLRRAQQLLSETVQNARTVHACGSEKRLIQLYQGMVLDSKTPVGKHVLGGLALGVSQSMMFFIMAGAFYVMAILLKDGTADFRDVMVSFMCIFFAAMGAGQAASMMGDASKATVAAHDAFALLDRQSKINGMRDLGTTPSDDVRPGRIEFKNVQFFYPFRPDVQVLKGVSFVVEAGQAIGVAGPSGGGKSTVISMIQRYYDPTEGVIIIGEKAKLSETNIRWWREQIGFVGQEPILFNDTVKVNVMYGVPEGRTISDEELEKCRIMAHLDFLELEGGKGWDTQVGPRGRHLSGGQKQRVAICRALVRNPHVLLLDEATSALDTASEAVVQSALEAARQGRTSFAIAHRLSTISNCDRIMVVAEGIVLENGTHEELMEQRGVYYKLQKQSQK